jgi:hypothetical protein
MSIRIRTVPLHTYGRGVVVSVMVMTGDAGV